jgi:hypothetical protein
LLLVLAAAAADRDWIKEGHWKPYDTSKSTMWRR